MASLAILSGHRVTNARTSRPKSTPPNPGQSSGRIPQKTRSRRSLPSAVGALSMFVVVTGLPGSGKSTLGALLASALRLPLIDKDTFLEQLFELDHTSPRHELSRCAEESFRNAAKSADGAVLISWWRHPHSAALSGTPTDWLSLLPGRAIEVHCACSPEVASSRFRSRVRHPRHEDEHRSDGELLAQLSAQAMLGPLGIAPLVHVNAEEPFDVPAILRSIEVGLGCSCHVQPAT